MDEKLKSLLDFFNVVDANREYLVSAFSDAIELYSLVNWNASEQDKIEYIASNSKANANANANAHLQIVNNNDNIRKNPKSYKINNSNGIPVQYGKSHLVKTKKSQKSYSFIAKIRFSDVKKDGLLPPELNNTPAFSLTLLKNGEFDEYLILVNYGDFFNPYSEQFNQILEMLHNYLKDKIIASARNLKENIKILFFGHSMGAIIVQHLYLYFHRHMEFSNSNLFIISSSIGNTLTEEDNKY